MRVCVGERERENVCICMCVFCMCVWELIYNVAYNIYKEYWISVIEHINLSQDNVDTE